jgi:DNA-binding NtrC family response regulator
MMVNREPVLLVDDDEFARGYARTVLERAGFAVHEAKDVASAIRAASASPPTAVVTDWNLPDGDGGALARRLHTDIDCLPVILITGDGAMAVPLPEIALHDFATVLYKPYPPSALARAVRAAVAR